MHNFQDKDLLVQYYKSHPLITHWNSGEEMKAFLESTEQSSRCVVTLTGAKWDGHFIHYLKSGSFLNLASLFNKREEGRLEVIFGIFFYYPEKLPVLKTRPLDNNDDRLVWEESDPTYYVYLFRNGSHLLDDKRVIQELRSSRLTQDFSEEVVREKIFQLCNISPFSSFSLEQEKFQIDEL